VPSFRTLDRQSFALDYKPPIQAGEFQVTGIGEATFCVVKMTPLYG